MKHLRKSIIFILLALMLLSSQAFAYVNTKPAVGYDIYWSDDAILFGVFNKYFNDKNAAIAVASPTASYYQYKVEISFDDLAAKVDAANEIGFVVSLHKNDNAGYWVGHFYDIDQSIWDGDVETPGVLSNTSGYVYVAEIDTSGEDTVNALNGILNYYYSWNTIFRNIMTSTGQIANYTSSINTWDDAITKTEEHLASIQSAMINIPTRLQDMHTELMDISDVLTGDDFTTMMVDVGDISSNLSQVKILLAQIYDQLASSTKSGTLAYNIAEMVTLLEDMQDLTISGDLTIDSVEVDTSSMEEKLDTINTTLTSNLIHKNNSSASYLHDIRQFLNTLCTIYAPGSYPGYQAMVSLMTQLNPNKTGTLVSNISAMLTNQENILTDLDSLNQVLESLGNIEGDFSALPNDIYSFITLPIENFEQRVMNSLELNDGYLEGISNNLLDLRDAVSDMTDAVSEMNETTVENITNITINEGDPAYEVFYVTDKDGNKQNLGDLGGDMLIAGGKLLNFFFKVAFDGAIESVDTTIDGMTEFYLDDAVVLEGSLWE